MPHRCVFLLFFLVSPFSLSLLFFSCLSSSSSFVPMRNTRDVHGRVRRLCRLYFTLCPVRKRIISSLLCRSLSLSLYFWLPENGHETSRKKKRERGREGESERTGRDGVAGRQEGEGEVSGGYASLFTGAPLFPIIRCD